MVNLLKGSAKMLYTEQIASECTAAKNVAVDAKADQAVKAALIARPAISFITDRMCRSGKRAVLRGVIPHKTVVSRWSKGTCDVSAANPQHEGEGLLSAPSANQL